MIDSHAHLSCPSLREQVDTILSRAQEANISCIVNIATDPDELAHALLLAERYPWIKVAGATTPHDVEKEGHSAFAAFEKAAREKKLVAIGETGLDYFYEHSDRKLQQEFLRSYIRLARECHLPLIIHCRDAFEDFFKILDEECGERWCPGVLHCFTGTLEDAATLVKHGWMISFSGIVTYKKSVSLRDVVKSVPIEHILVETDAPYLAPQMRRGQQNEPAFVIETAQVIAILKGMDFDLFSRTMETNLHSFLL
jgi:TatD DNase family protein